MTSYECQVAGVRIMVNRPAESEYPNVRGPAWCEVRFEAEDDASTKGWLNIPNPATGAVVAICPSGHTAVIVAADGDESDCARQLRWAVPFIAGLQGETILHASAVERAGRIFGFVAESGTGKSTFSSMLAKGGWNKVADDLLPECLGKPKALFFLQRPRGGKQAELRRLGAEAALRELVMNGFGELADASLWKTHFDYYCALLESVPCYELILPDGLELLEKTAEYWASQIEREGLL